MHARLQDKLQFPDVAESAGGPLVVVISSVGNPAAPFVEFKNEVSPQVVHVVPAVFVQGCPVILERGVIFGVGEVHFPQRLVGIFLVPRKAVSTDDIPVGFVGGPVGLHSDTVIDQ